MKSRKEMKSQKEKWNLNKKNENKIFSELKNFRFQSMSVSDNISPRQCQDVVNVSVRKCQCPIMSGSS